MKYLRIIMLTIVLLGLAGCGGDEEPTPAPTATNVPQPTFTVTSQPQPTNTALPTDTPEANGASAASASDSPLPAPVEAIASAAQSTSPLANPQNTGCSGSLHIDLSGYPDLKSLPTVLGCPQGDGALDPVAINEFGEGPDFDRFMLWFSNEKQIHVLFPNHTWLSYTDNWNEGEPEISCNSAISEAASPPLPRRGFGKVWCSVESVQKEMGLISREERLCQHSVSQRFEKGRLFACFEDATIRYFRILDDGKWDMMSVQ